jgi:hypothetical protein
VKLSKDLYVPWGISLLGFSIHLALFWPGLLSADSYTQLAQAQAGIFSNHHPVLMSLLWSYFIKIIPGSGFMLTFHLSLFWGSIGLFSYTFFKHKLRSWWWFYLIPLWPVFLCYSSMIWKDVGFSFSFMLAISILFHCSFEGKKPTFFQSSLIVFLLMYGVGVKYQAIYILPFCVFWLGFLISNAKYSKQTLLLSASFFIGIGGGNKIIDETFVPNAQQSNSWQMARLYDLAGISIFANQPNFPDYITNNTHFSMERLKKLYSFQNVDALMYAEQPTLIVTQNPKELSNLWESWKQAIINHPIFYASHRLGVWLKLINKNIADYYYYLNNETKNLIFKEITVPFLRAYLSIFPSLILRFYWVIPIFLLAMRRSKQKSLNPRLKFIYRMLVFISFSQLGIYFFLSMASDLRYLFLSNLLAFFLVPLIYASKEPYNRDSSQETMTKCGNNKLIAY